MHAKRCTLNANVYGKMVKYHVATQSNIFLVTPIAGIIVFYLRPAQQW